MKRSLGERPLGCLIRIPVATPIEPQRLPLHRGEHVPTSVGRSSMSNRSTGHRPSTLARLGLFLAVAAIAVNAPRLILVFLEAEGVPVSSELRVALLALTGIATGVVLTGGGAYLAHAVAWGRHFRPLLVVAWLIVLVATGILITPMLASGLAHAPLTAVLASSSSRWVWSAVAVLAVELVAAGSMVAYAAHRREDRATGDLEQELLDIATQRNRLAGELDQLRGDFEAERAEMLEDIRRLESDLEYRQLNSDSTTSPQPNATSGAAPESVAPASIPCRNGCGREFASPAAERGHQKGCPQRPVF